MAQPVYKPNTPAEQRQQEPAPHLVWLALLDRAEERARNAPIEQRPRHRRLFKYLAVRLARSVLRESGRR
jgi:hypothetical protein